MDKVRQQLIGCHQSRLPQTCKKEIISTKDTQRFLEFIKELGITDDVCYARSFGYYMGLILGGGDLSKVRPIIFEEYPNITRYMRYWVSTHPHGLTNYRAGVKDSKPGTLVLSHLYLRHFFDRK